MVCTFRILISRLKDGSVHRGRERGSVCGLNVPICSCCRQFVWDVVESTLLKQNRAYAQANKELTDVQEELRKVSDLDAVALGGETRQDLERKRELVEEKVEECERAHMDVFVALCRNLVHLLGSHLVSCALEKEDHETPWFCCTLDCLRQLLVQVCAVQGEMGVVLSCHVIPSLISHI